MFSAFLLLIAMGLSRSASAQHTPPKLDELTADYQDAVPLRDTPTVSNFWSDSPSLPLLPLLPPSLVSLSLSVSL